MDGLKRTNEEAENDVQERSEHDENVDDEEQRNEEDGEYDESSAKPSKAKRKKKAPAGPLSGVVAVVSDEVNAQAELSIILEKLGAKVLKRASKTMTHCVYGSGGKPSVASKCLGFSCVLVAPSWVHQCALEGQHVAPEPHVVPPPSTPSSEPTSSTKRPRASTTTTSSSSSSMVSIVSEGSLIPSSKLLCSKKALYPIGFVCTSMRPSPNAEKKNSKCSFVCSIVQKAQCAVPTPLFRIECPDEPSFSAVEGPSSAIASLMAATQVAEARGKEAPKSQDDWFCLQHATVRRQLEKLLPETKEGEEDVFAAYERLGPEEENAAAGEEDKKKKKNAEEEGQQQQEGGEEEAKKKAAKKVKRTPEEKAALAAEKQQRAEQKQKEAQEKAEKKQREAQERAEKKQKEAEEKERKLKEKEAAEQKKKAEREKMSVRNYFAKKPAPTAAAASPSTPAPSLASSTSDLTSLSRNGLSFEQIEKAIGKGTSFAPSIPDDYIAHYRTLKGKLPQRKSVSSHVVRTFRHHDDEFRPAIYVLHNRKDKQMHVNARRPFAQQLKNVDYDADSDEEWEGWDQVEDVLGEDDLLADEDEDDASGLEVGVDQFIVPDDVLVNEDDEVVHVTGACKPRKKEVEQREASVTGVFLGAANDSSMTEEVLGVLTPGLTFPIDPTSSCPWAEREARAAKAKRAASIDEAGRAILRSLLEKREHGSEKNLITAFMADIAGKVEKAPPKSAVSKAIREMAEWNGKCWLLNGLEAEQTDSVVAPSQQVEVVAPVVATTAAPTPSSPSPKQTTLLQFAKGK